MPFHPFRTLRRWWHTPRIRGNILVTVLALAAFSATLAIGVWTRACANGACPSIAELEGYDPDQASKVYAADGRLITDLGLHRRTVVPLAEIAPAVKAAFIVTEDKRFYHHRGVDWIRMLGAMKANLLAGRFVEGGSTITMQLAGNLWSDDIDRRRRRGAAGILRKLREIQVAREIERTYPKDKILELYLNQIDLGNRAFGVEAAAQRYFGKSVRDVNIAEAAMLAALPKAPSRYNPRTNRTLAIQRRNVVLNLMRDNGILTPEEAEQWKAYPLLLSSRSDYSDVAPYFVEYVRQQLDQRFGRELYSKGLRIYTTLDLEMQQAAERALEQQLEAIESGTSYGKFPHQTYADYLQGKSNGDDDRRETPYLQGVVVTLEAKTGYIRAMVGGRDFDDSKFNRATQALRQPGSTFKPIVFSAALRAGIPLSQILVDEPISVTDSSNVLQPTWEPQNYDNQFRGPMTIRDGLAQSINIIAIKLGMELGPEAVIAEARNFGLSTRIPPYPSIYIGSADVIPLELIAAYTAFANLGPRSIPVGILRVEDRNGNVLWQPGTKQIPVMSPEQAWLMTDLLRDVVRRGTAAGSVGARFPIPSGGKTGTTNDYNDVWYVGFTPELVTGIWIGLDRPRKIMANAQGGRLAAPAWTALMREIYERRSPPAGWARPEGLTIAEIDKTTGYKALPTCPREVHLVESFIPGTEPTTFCPVHPLPLGIGNPLLGNPPAAAPAATLPGAGTPQQAQQQPPPPSPTAGNPLLGQPPRPR
ncbi:MAG TPA: PBP1A family penicillin-binding protein [Gemmatimonadales bacterium]|nr:PBP1A family penicillin-binding protein [Gemmatimonadales bacterium]